MLPQRPMGALLEALVLGGERAEALQLWRAAAARALPPPPLPLPLPLRLLLAHPYSSPTPTLTPTRRGAAATGLRVPRRTLLRLLRASAELVPRGEEDALLQLYSGRLFGEGVGPELELIRAYARRGSLATALEVSLDLPTPPNTSLHLPTPPYTSLYLPIPPSRSTGSAAPPRVPCSASCARRGAGPTPPEAPTAPTAPTARTARTARKAPPRARSCWRPRSERASMPGSCAPRCASSGLEQG